jgi:hypothetical protein
MFTSWRPDGDVPWWYNERASLSILSGAIWLSGGIAFEEYSDSKRRISRRTGRLLTSYAGRVDFYFEISGHEFKGETKFCWPGASTLWRDQTEFMTYSLDEAKRDIRKAHPEGQRRLAVVFATPFVSERQEKGLKKRIERIVDQVTKLDGDAFAWVFPHIERCISESGRLYPGTAVIIKEVKR